MDVLNHTNLLTQNVGHEPVGSFPVAKIQIVEKVPESTFKKQYSFQVSILFKCVFIC